MPEISRVCPRCGYAFESFEEGQCPRCAHFAEIHQEPTPHHATLDTDSKPADFQPQENYSHQSPTLAAHPVDPLRSSMRSVLSRWSMVSFLCMLASACEIIWAFKEGYFHNQFWLYLQLVVALILACTADSTQLRYMRNQPADSLTSLQWYIHRTVLCGAFVSTIIIITFFAQNYGYGRVSDYGSRYVIFGAHHTVLYDLVHIPRNIPGYIAHRIEQGDPPHSYDIVYATENDYQKSSAGITGIMSMLMLFFFFVRWWYSGVWVRLTDHE